MFIKHHKFMEVTYFTLTELYENAIMVSVKSQKSKEGRDFRKYSLNKSYVLKC